MGYILTEKEWQAMWSVGQDWAVDPQQEEPPVWAMEGLTLETLARAAYTQSAERRMAGGGQAATTTLRDPDRQDVEAETRLCCQDIWALRDADPRAVRSTIATTMTVWWQANRKFAPQVIPIDVLLAAAAAGGPGPPSEGAPWPPVQVEEDTVLVRAGRGPEAPKAFRAELRQGHKVIMSPVAAQAGVVRLPLAQVRTAQRQGAECLVIVAEDGRAVAELLQRCADQVAALWSFQYLTTRQGAPEGELKRPVWDLLLTRTVEHILLPRLRQVPWVNAALHRAQREGAENTDLTQACITAMLSCRFTYRNMGQAIVFFTFKDTDKDMDKKRSKFGHKLVRTLASPTVAAQPASHPEVDVTPDVAQQQEQEAEAARQQAAWSWAQTQHAFADAGRQTALRAWFLSAWRYDHKLTLKEIAAELRQPGCGELFELFDEADWPPAVAREEAQQTLQGMSYDAVRQFFSRSRYGRRLVKIRRWLGLIRGLGQEEAIRLWTVWWCRAQAGYAWETVSEIVQRLHEVGTQNSTAFDLMGCQPPDPRLCDVQCPLVPWGTVARAWAQVPADQRTAEALQCRYAEILHRWQQGDDEGNL